MAAASQQQAVIQKKPCIYGASQTQIAKRPPLLYRNLQQDNHEIILMGDFNEEYGADPEGMIEIARFCSLVDIFHSRLGASQFATFIGGRTRIDYALASAGPAAAVRQCGFEPPAFRFKGDHRGPFLEFDTKENTTLTLC
jgi:endonuclease/exonuclease/phosphatase family metal-dependent hydrolase